VLSSNASAGVSAPAIELAASHGQVVSVISVDLNLGELVTRQIIPGMSASNSIAVVQSSQSGDVGGIIGKVGLSFNVEFDRSEGFHQALRTLIELFAVEISAKSRACLIGSASKSIRPIPHTVPKRASGSMRPSSVILSRVTRPSTILWRAVASISISTIG